jgi:hypothetical protein
MYGWVGGWDRGNSGLSTTKEDCWKKKKKRNRNRRRYSRSCYAAAASRRRREGKGKGRVNIPFGVPTGVPSGNWLSRDSKRNKEEKALSQKEAEVPKQTTRWSCIYVCSSGSLFMAPIPTTSYTRHNNNNNNKLPLALHANRFDNINNNNKRKETQVYQLDPTKKGGDPPKSQAVEHHTHTHSYPYLR